MKQVFLHTHVSCNHTCKTFKKKVHHQTPQIKHIICPLWKKISVECFHDLSEHWTRSLIWSYTTPHPDKPKSLQLLTSDKHKSPYFWNHLQNPFLSFWLSFSHHSILQHAALIYPLDSRSKQAHPKDQGIGLQDFLSSHQLPTVHTRSACPELWISRWLCNTLKQQMLTYNIRASIYCRGTASDLTFTVSHLC